MDIEQGSSAVEQSLSEIKQLEEERRVREAEEERLRFEAAENERQERERKQQEDKEARRLAAEERKRAEAAAQDRASFLDVERRLAAREHELRNEFDMERDRIRVQAVREAKLAPWKIAGPVIGIAIFAVLAAALLILSARSERDLARQAAMQTAAAGSERNRELTRRLEAAESARANLQRELDRVVSSGTSPAKSVSGSPNAIRKASRNRTTRPLQKRDELSLPASDLSSDDPIRGIAE